ncbi:hypothetical protein QCE49_33360 [Caballeronia sp. LZ008]|uniref:hypothetical protein n=1 Tax=unclassified Caballeronia TaxID=2646786 RepID=UPI0020297CDC|nr:MULTISPECIES: hypothetical protein [unclassified Caballeronia]MDR5798290.1 hypothetical protein [Caballeronia sp. LZ008]
MKKFALLAAGIFELLCGDTARAEGLCSTKEAVIFNCEFSRSTSSLCESSDGSVIYRAGLREKVRMELSPKDSKTKFYLSSRPLVGGGEVHVRFENDGYVYYLFDRMVLARDESDSSAGVIAFRKGRKVFDRRCDNDASVRQRGYEVLPREDFRDIGAK